MGGHFTRPDLVGTNRFFRRSFAEFRVCARLAGRFQKHPKASRPPTIEQVCFRFLSVLFLTIRSNHLIS